MILKRLKISTWIGDDTNCYIVFDQDSKETMVIDPAGDVDRIIDINLTEFMEGFPEIELEADSRIDDGDLLHIGDLEFKVIHTPGHTRGGASLYQKEQKLLFSGDTLFRGTWGRTDLPTSDFKQIMESITKKLMILPEDTIVYPGHRKINNDWKRKANIFRTKAKENLTFGIVPNEKNHIVFHYSDTSTYVEKFT